MRVRGKGRGRIGKGKGKAAAVASKQKARPPCFVKFRYCRTTSTLQVAGRWLEASLGAFRSGEGLDLIAEDIAQAAVVVKEDVADSIDDFGDLDQTHHADDGTDADPFENVNVVDDHDDVRRELFEVLRRKFDD